MISAIAVIGKNRELGSENKLLWHIPGELPRFKHITMGHPIIMGRKTFQSIGRVLPGRTNIIITRDRDFKVEGGVVVDSFERALDEAKKNEGADEIFVIGGGEIFKQSLPMTNRLYLTLVEKDYSGADTFFPDYSDFKKVVSEEKKTENDFNYSFVTLER